MTTPRIPLSAKIATALRVPSIVTWSRLEGRPRSEDFERSLRAEVRDPLWMLTRQWQLGELTAMDGGTPVLVKIASETEQLAAVSDAGARSSDRDLDVPLEARVEREQPPSDLRTRVQVGRSWLRLLARRFGDDRYRALYAGAYAISATDDPSLQQWYSAVAAHAVDGLRLVADARAGIAIEAATAGDLRVTDGDKLAVREVMAELLAVYARAVSVPQPDEQTWVAEALEYRFGITMRSQAGATTELASTQYYGGHLDWYGLDVHARTPGTGAATPTTRTYLPTPVTFAGMPSARWWEIEDERLDLGAVDAHTTDIATLMLIEFGLTFGNDWSVVALPVAAGSLCRLTSVVVTDVFGQQTSVAPAHADGSTWSMFELAARDRASAIFVPAVIASPREGAPIERVDFMRDEMANLVWAVESTLPDGLGGGRDAFEARSEAPVATQPSEVLRYQLIGSIPEPWIPFVPVHVPGSSREVQLQRGAMLRSDGTPVRPRGLLLHPFADQPYFIHEEEIGRAGAQVARRWRRARTSDGRVVIWLGRSRSASAGEGSSGLRFDEAR